MTELRLGRREYVDARGDGMHGHIPPEDVVVADGHAVQVGAEHGHRRQQTLDHIRPCVQ